MSAPGATAAVATTVGRRRSKPVGGAERHWLLWPPLVFFLLLLVVPLVALFQQALSKHGNTFSEAVHMDVFAGSVERTLALAACVTVITVALGACYALAAVAGPAWARAVLMAGLLISLWTSIMVRTFGWMLMELPTGAIYWALDRLHLRSTPLGLYQTTPGMYPPMVAVMLPFAILPMIASLSSLDREQVSAATVFGAGPLLVLRAVILPALRPALISAAVLVFVMALGFYVTPLLLGGPSNMTLSGVINAQLNNANRADVGAALSIILIAGTVVIYLIADRLFKVSERFG
jgi:putative spermidine/putrescine transport system permease protein